jgi:hypothetical protein
MFDVELRYRTKMGNLTFTMTNTETVATREEANELREALRSMPDLGDAEVRIKNAKPPPTVDEALERIVAELRKFPVLKREETS